ncbi:hypothetical protein GZH47_25455 [Paenibacillus rhizovicinus]|uniref:DUF4412 domain-containing protein n=1 Tax=Paenibacillus rhizovicinus TaxID=2704463 RepID=A0A6C0P854_9BACL|nr:hypothetical protein [Paenibacillus rhizovicinus]QHW33813.1 hypothetical protein GZH47_25455 [Paenibacillus rhizovicinus]
MKRRPYLILISFLVFLVAGCSQSSSYGTPAPIKNLKWGMNVKETLDVLGIAEKGLTETSSLGTTRIFKANEKIKIHDRPAEVSFTFDYYSPEPILFRITAKFKPEDVAYIEKELNKQRGQGSILQYNGKNEPMQISWKDASLQTNKEWLAAVEKVYTAMGMKITENLMENGVNVMDKPITSCVLESDTNSPRYGTVSFDGSVAAMLNYPERFVPKK